MFFFFLSIIWIFINCWPSRNLKWNFLPKNIFFPTNNLLTFKYEQRTLWNIIHLPSGEASTCYALPHSLTLLGAAPPFHVALAPLFAFISHKRGSSSAFNDLLCFQHLFFAFCFCASTVVGFSGSRLAPPAIQSSTRQYMHICRRVCVSSRLDFSIHLKLYCAGLLSLRCLPVYTPNMESETGFIVRKYKSE